MNNVIERFINALPTVDYPYALGKIMFTDTNPDNKPLDAKILPSGRVIGLYYNNTDLPCRYALYGTNGEGGFCFQPQPEQPCPEDWETRNVPVCHGTPIIALAGRTRWIPVHPDDEQRIINELLGHNIAQSNPVAMSDGTRPPSLLPENIPALFEKYKLQLAVAAALLLVYLILKK